MQLELALKFCTDECLKVVDLSAAKEFTPDQTRRARVCTVDHILVKANRSHAWQSYYIALGLYHLRRLSIRHAHDR